MMYGYYEQSLRTYKLIYNRQVHFFKALCALDAVNELAKEFPELSNMKKFQTISVGENAFVIEARKISFEYIDARNIDPEPYMGAFAEMFIDNSIKANNEAHMVRLIDEALARKDEAEFLRLTSIYKQTKELTHA